jgi:hypothetical protein
MGVMVNIQKPVRSAHSTVALCHLGWLYAGAAGMLGGFVGNGVLGLLFSTPVVRSVLYDPRLQSELFIEITPQRNIPVSVAGLIVLSAVHGWFFAQFAGSIPGVAWWRKGLYWGLVIFALYWVPQEWFIYHTLLGEPLLLNLLELSLLLVGSMAEGLVIARCLRPQ